MLDFSSDNSQAMLAEGLWELKFNTFESPRLKRLFFINELHLISAPYLAKHNLKTSIDAKWQLLFEHLISAISTNHILQTTMSCSYTAFNQDQIHQSSTYYNVWTESLCEWQRHLLSLCWQKQKAAQCMVLNYRDDMNKCKSGGASFSSLLVSIIRNHICFAAFPFGVGWGKMGRLAHLRRMTLL